MTATSQIAAAAGPKQGYILVTAAGEAFGLPVSQVVSVFRVDACTRVPTAHPHVAGILSHRGKMIAAISLRARLGAPPAPSSGAPLAIGVEHGGETVALIVDSVGDLVHFGADSLVAFPEGPGGRLPDLIACVHGGETGLTPILDIAALCRFGTDAAPAGDAIC